MLSEAPAVLLLQTAQQVPNCCTEGLRSATVWRQPGWGLRSLLCVQVLKLLWCREKWLAVSAIRFLRSCIALKDNFYYRYLIRNNHFAPVIDRFLANGARCAPHHSLDLLLLGYPL